MAVRPSRYIQGRRSNSTIEAASPAGCGGSRSVANRVFSGTFHPLTSPAPRSLSFPSTTVVSAIEPLVSMTNSTADLSLSCCHAWGKSRTAPPNCRCPAVTRGGEKATSILGTSACLCDDPTLPSAKQSHFWRSGCPYLIISCFALLALPHSGGRRRTRSRATTAGRAGLLGSGGRPLDEIVHAQNAVDGLLCTAHQLDTVDCVAELARRPNVRCGGDDGSKAEGYRMDVCVVRVHH